MSSNRCYSLGFAVFITVIFIDQLSKYALLNLVGDGSQVNILPIFNLVMVWNRGVSFGMLASDHVLMRWGLTALAIAVVGALTFWFYKTPSKLTAWSVGFIAGGAIGNVIDRLRFGAVADFFDFHINDYHWPAFNVADSCIFIGVVILCALEFFAKGAIEQKNEEPE